MQTVRAQSRDAAQKNFERKEKKYLLSAGQYDALFGVLKDRIREDGYGRTAVLSLYYDNSSYDLLGRSADRPMYKEKFRIRSYGVPGEDSAVFAEIKKKFDGVVYKRRVKGTYREILDMLEGDILPDRDVQIQKEILWMKDRYDLAPAAFIAYDRTAYTSPSDPGFRLTVDSDIRYRLTDLDLRKGDHGIPLREPGFRIMEIKTEGNMPLWLTQILSKEKIYSGSFSKIGTCYKEVIVPALRAEGNGYRRIQDV